MDINWENLITKFTQLGGTVENICQKQGKNGRGIFSINKNKKSKIYIPKTLLININDIEENNGELNLKSGSKYSKEIKEFFYLYEKDFSWGMGGKEITMHFEESLKLLPSKVKQLIKNNLAIDLFTRYRYKWEEVILREFLNARKFYFSGENKIAPILELVNHENHAQPYIKTESGLSTPNYEPMEGEITHSYGYRSPIKRLFEYGFFSKESIVFSIPFSLEIKKDNTSLICYGEELFNDLMISKLTTNNINVKGFPIADKNYPLLPEKYLERFIHKNNLEVSHKDLLRRIKVLNIKKREEVLLEINNINNYASKLIKQCLNYELNLIRKND